MADDDTTPDPDPETELAEAAAAADAAGEAVETDILLLVAERDEFRSAAQRLQADFENYKKRVQREEAVTADRARERLLESMLPALDSFELASASLEGAADADALERLRKGVSLAISQLHEALSGAGLERIDATGVAFDPNEHEAVMQDDGAGDPLVGQILRTGYRLRGRVVRPAMVQVTHATS